MNKALIFRFDASDKIGIGHAFRCMALIERLSLHDNMHCCVLSKPLPEFIVHRLKELEAQLILLHAECSLDDEQVQIARLIEPSDVEGVIVLDGYQFSQQYRQQLLALNVKVVTFDDTNDLQQLHCNVLINALPFADRIGYQNTAKQAKHLTGLNYSIIREEFIKSKKQAFALREKLLINFGGSDIANLTLPVIKRLMQRHNFESLAHIIVITGGAYSGSHQISQLAKEAGFTHLHNCKNMADILPLCKMAICAPGAIVYELAYCGVPSIFLTVADNQLLSAQAHQDIGWCKVENGLNQQGITLALKHLSELWSNHVLLNTMSSTAQALIDGQGVARICQEIKGMLE